MWSIIFLVLLGLLFVSAGITLFLGKGSWIIAGYNTASEEEKAKYDKKKLCKSMGVLCIIVAVLLFTMIYFTYQVEMGILRAIVIKTSFWFCHSAGVCCYCGNDLL